MKFSSRRRFIKAGITAAGAGMIIPSGLMGQDCDPEVLPAPGPIPLNDLLSNYEQVNEKYGSGLQNTGICDLAAWENKKRSILRRAVTILGKAPLVSGNSINPEILKEIPRDGYKELKVQFPSGTGDMIKGYLLVPDQSMESSPGPAIIALHSTGPGASQTIGLEPPENLGYGKELAQRGYVVLAIDTIAAGERVYQGFGSYYTNEFYKEFPQWSAMDKMIHDHKKGLDILCSLKIVDPRRIGCIGHSLGGYNSFFLQAFDSRIKAAVSSCGLSTMGGTNMPYQFARSDWFVHFNPGCRDYIQAGMIPCDVHEIMALCAPRPLFNYSAREDSIYYPSAVREDRGFGEWWQTVDRALTQVSRIYDIHGKSDCFVRMENDGGHDFPPEVRESAYLWLEKWI